MVSTLRLYTVKFYAVKVSEQAPSRRVPLTRERVVEAALELIDAEGVASLSMRRLGRKLGVEGMALYTHVRDKDDLLRAVAERLLAELSLPPLPREDWEGRIRGVVAAWAGLQVRHPESFPLLYRDRPMTARDADVVEELLDALRTAGLSEEQAAVSYGALVGCLDGMLLARYLTSYDAAEVWRHGARTLDAARYPRYLEVAPHAAEVGGPAIFERGLELLLAGIRSEAAP
jgi:AcrR family transcriptional regulator